MRLHMYVIEFLIGNIYGFVYKEFLDKVISNIGERLTLALKFNLTFHYMDDLILFDLNKIQQYLCWIRLGTNFL